jgi:hypothetical protein
MANASIPISDCTLARLRELSRWSGMSLDAALDQAIKDQYDRRFWEATDAGYAALRADPDAWAEFQQEHRSLDGTLLDGLDPEEQWDTDGNVVSPAPREIPS